MRDTSTESDSRMIVFLTGSSVVWGAESSLLLIAAELRHQVRVKLIASNRALAARWAESVGADVKCVVARRGRVTRLGAFLGPLRDVKPGSVVVLFDFYLLPLLVPLRRALKRRGVEVVVDLHDSSRGSWRRGAYFWLLRLCDSVIAVSNFVAEEVPHGVPVSVVWRPVPTLEETALRDPQALSRRCKSAHATIGIVGQVTPDKRVLEAISILEYLPSALVQVRGAKIGGKDDYLARVLAYGASFGRRFSAVGPVAREEAMTGLDFLLLANVSEPFGRVVAEAQASGVLAVVPNAGGAAEIVDDGLTGLVYPAGDIAAAADRIRTVLAEPAKGDEISFNSRGWARQAFSPVEIAQRYLRALIGSVG